MFVFNTPRFMQFLNLCHRALLDALDDTNKTHYLDSGIVDMTLVIDIMLDGMDYHGFNDTDTWRNNYRLDYICVPAPTVHIH